MFTIGADPELFAVDRKTGKGVSAHDLVPGSKKEPHAVNNGAVQPDGLSAEFNIDPTPVNDWNGFNNNILQVTKQLRDMLPKKLKLVAKPTQDFDPEYLQSLPPSALELGCDPDFNAYTGKPNPIPDGTRAFRTGSGHIHIGWGADIPIDSPEHLDICRVTVKTLDVYVGLFSLLIDRDPRRRELYGKAGAYRPKSYGVEYRVPSNMWLISKSTRQSVFLLVNDALRYLQMTRGELRGRDFSMLNIDEVESYINSGNLEMAKTFFRDRYKVVFDDDNNPLVDKIRRSRSWTGSKTLATAIEQAYNDATAYRAKMGLPE